MNNRVRVVIFLMFLSYFQTTAHAQGVLDPFWGAMQCAWNYDEGSCLVSGCTWDAGSCTSFSALDRSIFVDGPLSLQQSALRQMAFAGHTQILDRAFIRERFMHYEDFSGYDSYHFSTLHHLLTIQGSNGFYHAVNAMRKIKDFAQYPTRLQAVDLLMLLAPKLTEPQIVWRGLSADCKEEWMTNPNSFVSTSYTREVTNVFSKNCLLEIKLPAGFPGLIIDSVKKDKVYSKKEYEVLLPSYLLGPGGDLVPLRFAISQKEKRGDLNFFVIEPVDFWQLESKSFSHLLQFERDYIARACSQTIVTEKPELIYMCAITKEHYHLSLTPQESEVIHPKVRGTYRASCVECTLQESEFSCRCGKDSMDSQKKTPNAEIDLRICPELNVYYDKDKLHCSDSNVPEVLQLDAATTTDCSRWKGVLYCSSRAGMFPITECLSSQKLIVVSGSLPICADVPDGPWSKTCQYCVYIRDKLQCECGNQWVEFSDPCSGKPVMVTSRGEFLCLDDDQVPSGDYDNCACGLKSNELHCSCPTKSQLIRSAIIDSKLSLPCAGTIRVRNHKLECNLQSINDNL